ncbi:MAG: PEP-CTERM sorting domain-containing protein [Akkermansia sp.]|nr:PEP-CTERM sorting domain-containing protein [Akkermansia sp.]
MKKTLIALLALAGMASGATTFTWDASQEYSYTWDFSATNTQNGQTGVLGGTVTNTFITEDVANVGTAIKKGDSTGSYWEVNTNSFLHDALETVSTSAATLTLTLDYYYTGAQWGENILHVGCNGTGVAFGLSNGYLSFALGTAVDDTFAANKTDLRLTTNAWNTITYTLTDGTWTASVNGQTSDAKSIGDIAWDANPDEVNKYSIGIKAPGWDSGATGLNDSGCKIANMSISYAPVPEPATASLSLLGLAALMIRRRRA